MRAIALLSALLLPLAAPAGDWRTDAEASGYRRTPDLAATMAWIERLAAATDTVRVERFGTSAEGRPLHVVVASADRAFTPERAHARGHSVLWVQAGIHPGEIEGKDAGLALLRDLTVAARHRGLLDGTVLVFIPVFNVDGHERSGPHNRVNQDGPESVGWRATAQNLNLNRDHVKADAPEMRAWLGLWNRWRPHLLVDLHTTNGADYEYDLTWYLEEWGNQAQAIRDWQQAALVGRVFPATDRRGHVLGPYINLVDHRDPRAGLVNFGSGPRFSTGYAALRRRPGLLVETHMLKSYRRRVRATYHLLLELLRELDSNGAALRAAVATAEAAALARAAQEAPRLAVAFRPADTPEDFVLRGVAFTQERSDVSGDTWIRYDPSRPQRYEVPFRRAMVPVAEVALPAAYVLRPSAAEAIARVEAHGLAHFRLAAAAAVAARGWRVSGPTWAPLPFEGRHALVSFEAADLARSVALPAGSLVVPLDQPAADLAVQLFEPAAPDSLLRWGFFDAHFERKEYADPRKLERLARDMLAADPALGEAFARALADPAFAASPAARLDFFPRRSPWADPELGVLPVWRIDRAELARLREQVR
ncbi:MAG: M14 family metallopeptidase [Pseudomonadota bacterium]